MFRKNRLVAEPLMTPQPFPVLKSALVLSLPVFEIRRKELVTGATGQGSCQLGCRASGRGSGTGQRFSQRPSWLFLSASRFAIASAPWRRRADERQGCSLYSCRLCLHSPPSKRDASGGGGGFFLEPGRKRMPSRALYRGDGAGSPRPVGSGYDMGAYEQ